MALPKSEKWPSLIEKGGPLLAAFF